MGLQIDGDSGPVQLDSESTNLLLWRSPLEERCVGALESQKTRNKPTRGSHWCPICQPKGTVWLSGKCFGAARKSKCRVFYQTSIL